MDSMTHKIMRGKRSALDLLSLCLFLTAAALPVSAQQPAWFVFGRESGCIDLQALAKHERLPRVPASPGDFVFMLQERGERVETGLPPEFPPEFAGRVVQVRDSNGKAPIFVQEDICKTVAR